MCFSSVPQQQQMPPMDKRAIQQQLLSNPLLRGKTSLAPGTTLSPEISSLSPGMSVPSPTAVAGGSQSINAVAPRRALGILQNIKTRR